MYESLCIFFGREFEIKDWISCRNLNWEGIPQEKVYSQIRDIGKRSLYVSYTETWVLLPRRERSCCGNFWIIAALLKSMATEIQSWKGRAERDASHWVLVLSPGPSAALIATVQTWGCQSLSIAMMNTWVIWFIVAKVSVRVQLTSLLFGQCWGRADTEGLDRRKLFPLWLSVGKAGEDKLDPFRTPLSLAS